MNYLIVLIIGFALGWILSTQKHFSTKLGASKISFISKQQEEKERNKQAIYGLLETNHPLTNSDVQMMLDIPESTATRYFDELEKEGKVKQVGKTGRGVSYERI